MKNAMLGHLCGPFLKSLQCLHISLVLESQYLDPELQMCLSEQKGSNHFS